MARASRVRSEPKTILGFFLAFLGIVEAGVAFLAATLVLSDQLQAAVFVMIAGLVVALAVVAWVAVSHARNPTALMLGQVTAREYLAVQRWTAGDSDAGEQPRTLALPAAGLDAEGAIEVVETAAIGQSAADEATDG